MADKKHVLFLDDEPFFARKYIHELEKLFVVHFRERAEDALLLVRAESPRIEGIVLDVMMPPPEQVPAHLVLDGLSTGLWFLKQVRDLVERRPIPTLILTNRLLETVRKGMREEGMPAQRLVEVWAKNETGAEILPHRLEALMLRVERGGAGG